MKQNAITQAIGALKLVPIFVNNPAIVSRATMIGASTEAVALLEAIPAASTELIEVFRCVNAVTSDGHICAAAMGKTKEGLAELIRLKLLPPQEGYGEDPA